MEVATCESEKDGRVWRFSFGNRPWHALSCCCCCCKIFDAHSSSKPRVVCYLCWKRLAFAEWIESRSLLQHVTCRAVRACVNAHSLYTCAVTYRHECHGKRTTTHGMKRNFRATYRLLIWPRWLIRVLSVRRLGRPGLRWSLLLRWLLWMLLSLLAGLRRGRRSILAPLSRLRGRLIHCRDKYAKLDAVFGRLPDPVTKKRRARVERSRGRAKAGGPDSLQLLVPFFGCAKKNCAGRGGLVTRRGNVTRDDGSSKQPTGSLLAAVRWV